MRNKFDQQLEQLHQELIHMGAMVEHAIDMALESLNTKNVDLARQAIDYDEEVNEQEKHIENMCFALLSLQAPVASDLRKVSAAMKMVTDMERIGDQAQDISELSIQLAKAPNIMPPPQIDTMAKEAVQMVIGSLESFIEDDKEKAGAIIARDDVVDQLFLEAKKQIVDFIRKDAKQGELAADYLMIAKYFERIADHATNIAEWVQFM